jgi:hypothetical protein
MIVHSDSFRSFLAQFIHMRGPHREGQFPKSHIVKRFGGRGRDRTGDPLLAKRESRF